MNERNKKAVEIKMSLLNLTPPLNEFRSPTLSQFFTILQDWVDNDKKYYGILNLPEIKKDIVYQLEKPKNTVVKLTEENKEQMNPEPHINTTKIGRNDTCPCDSGKKYKKCCLD